MNSTKASGAHNPQDSPLFLPGWSRSSSDLSDDFDSHRSMVVSMTSPVNQGGDSTGSRIPLSIKAQGMMNTHRIMKQLWSPTKDYKAWKPKAQFDVDNWDERMSKMQSLVDPAKGFLQEDQLQKRRMVFKDDRKDELQVKRLYLPPRV